MSETRYTLKDQVQQRYTPTDGSSRTGPPALPSPMPPRAPCEWPISAFTTFVGGGKQGSRACLLSRPTKYARGMGAGKAAAYVVLMFALSAAQDRHSQAALKDLPLPWVVATLHFGAGLLWIFPAWVCRKKRGEGEGCNVHRHSMA